MHLPLLLLLLGLVPLTSLAQKPKELTTTEAPLAGHSHQGHAFNEGPRQAGPLIEGTGAVHLPITTSWDQGQAYFHQGLGQIHGFSYYEAERSFRQILAHDPDCVMAYLGLIWANWENPKRAKKFLQKGNEIFEKSTLTKLEKSYFAANKKFFSDNPKDIKERRTAHLKDLWKITRDFPDDLEAKAFLLCRSWQFSRFTGKIKDLEKLESVIKQIFEKSPLHPAHHFAIHLWDSKDHYPKALHSAAKLGSTAPTIAHMWHMPVHIYSKAKRHHDATWHLEASSRIDHAHMQHHYLLPDQIHNYTHNNKWLAENYTLIGNASAAVDMAKSLLANPRHPKRNTIGKRGSSSNYGSTELIKILETFELWPQVIELSEKQWIEKLPQATDERLRLRLLGLAHFHLRQKDQLTPIITQLDTLHKKALADQKEAQNKARKKATKEKKNKKDIEKAVKQAGNKFNNKIKPLTKFLGELRGCLAELNGDTQTAKKSLIHITNKSTKMRRQFALGDLDGVREIAEKQLVRNDKKTAELAQAIHTFYHCQKEDAEGVREAFDKLRATSSAIDLTAPPFARLAPIAKKLGHPTDWRIPYTPADDLAPRPSLDTLGPIHWTPPAAKNFSLPDQHHKKISLTDYQGQPFILVFYLGAGCLHCTEQLTAMADRYTDFQKANLPILAISTDSIADLKESQENYSKGTIPFPLISDQKKDIFKAYTAHDDFENQPLHGTFIIDAKSRVLWTDISADPFMDLDFLIQEATRLLQHHH